MLKTALRITALLALAIGTTAATHAASAAERSGKAPAKAVPAATTTPAITTTPGATTTAGIKGWARMYFPAPGNDVQVSVDAHGTYTSMSPVFPTRAWGTFRISHRIDQPDGRPPLTYWADFKVDCLTTGGPTATVTGTVVRASDNPRDPWQDMLKDHVRMGVSFYVAGKDGGPSRIGLSGEAGRTLSKCMAPAADAPVIKGGYRLKDKGPLH
ncbi:hypothetical protein ACH4SK_19965 [Streptomyces inhibens]|uniref:hypothetical protein n=1 Tax=Streptomyces inhibens TaxID=2293571 RepID=UPI0037923C94